MKKSILSILAIAAITLTSCKDDVEQSSTSFVVNAADLKGSITSGTVTLNPAETYTLTGVLSVKSGATLTIPAGTKIQSSPTADATTLYVAVEKGGKININGTATNPVVFTSGKSVPAQGDWGGIIVCGDAPTNVGNNAISEIGGLTYGGTNSVDNSGSITYVKIEYSGSIASTTKEYNGLSLFAVGSGTTINNVYTLESGDDAIEFYGGTVNASELYLENSYDDSLDYADGYTGAITNVYITGVTKAAIEGSNNANDGNKTPMTNAIITNITVVKGADVKFTAAEQVVNYKEGGGKQKYVNLFVDGITTNFAKVAGTDTPALNNITAGNFLIQNYQFSGTQNYGSFSGTTTSLGAGNGSAKPSWANWII